MPRREDSLEAEEVAAPTGGDGPAEAKLTDQQLRTLAEILYQMILDELRIERERLGR